MSNAARAKGVDERRVLWRHVFRNALIPIMTGGDFDVQRRAEEVPVAEYLAVAAALPRAGGVGSPAP